MNAKNFKMEILLFQVGKTHLWAFGASEAECINRSPLNE